LPYQIAYHLYQSTVDPPKNFHPNEESFMGRQILLLITGMLLMAPSQVTAQESADEAAVRKVVQYYFDAGENENNDSMKKAFHRQAISLLRGADDRLIEIRHAVIRDNTRFSDRPLPMVARIISMWVSEEAASVRVEFRYPTAYPGDKADLRKPPPGFERTEYLSLIRFKDGWKIVTRVISVFRSDLAKVIHLPPSRQYNTSSQVSRGSASLNSKD
jgi:hypothetical protein